MTSRRRLSIYIVLFLAWVAFAAWQYNEYRLRSRLAREIPDRQAHSIMNALVGGIRSHCRLGRFIREQLQGVLDELVESDDVVAVSISDSGGRLLISAGDLQSIPLGPPFEGNRLADNGYLLMKPFGLSAVSLRGGACDGCAYVQDAGLDAALDRAAGQGQFEKTKGKGLGPGLGLGRGRESGRGRGLGPGQGRGLEPGQGRGLEPGQGRGLDREQNEKPTDPETKSATEPETELIGFGRTWLFDDAREESSCLAGGLFHATLLLDRKPFDTLCRMAFWEFVWAIIGGAVVMLCMAAAWTATVRLAEARGTAEVLEIEARHLRELSQAATGLAHETRNPLGLVRGWTQQLAQAGLNSPEDRAHARAVVEECDRITARINQFLAYAKPCNPSLAAVGVGEVVDELAVLLQPDVESRRVALDVRIDDLTIRADREMLRQALFNLLQNAICFSPADSMVEVSAALRQDGAWQIEVSDCGPGVPAENVDSLFMPYFTTRADGTGLGLAIVSRIATAHGWKIKYHPRAGGGAVFRLSSGNG